MNVFVEGGIAPNSPNIRFLEGVDLIETDNRHIKQVLRNQLGEAPYGISIKRHQIRYSPPAEGGMQTVLFQGRKITLSWSWGLCSEFLYVIPKLLSGIFYPMNEQNGTCNKRSLERAFTRIALNALEEAPPHEQEQSQRELQKAYNQGIRIIFEIANNRRYFESEIITSWPCSAFKAGYYLTQKIPFIRGEEPFTLFELNNKITSILMNGRELLELYKPQAIEVPIAQERVRRAQAESCESQFFSNLITTLSNFGLQWVGQFNTLRAISGTLTRTQYTIERLQLVADALQQYLHQRQLPNDDTPRYLATYWTEVQDIQLQYLNV